MTYVAFIKTEFDLPNVTLPNVIPSEAVWSDKLHHDFAKWVVRQHPHFSFALGFSGQWAYAMEVTHNSFSIGKIRFQSWPKSSVELSGRRIHVQRGNGKKTTIEAKARKMFAQYFQPLDAAQLRDVGATMVKNVTTNYARRVQSAEWEFQSALGEVGRKFLLENFALFMEYFRAKVAVPSRQMELRKAYDQYVKAVELKGDVDNIDSAAWLLVAVEGTDMFVVSTNLRGELGDPMFVAYDALPETVQTAIGMLRLSNSDGVIPGYGVKSGNAYLIHDPSVITEVVCGDSESA